MERNYDEIIADMLIQLEVHRQELMKHSQELTKQSQASDILRVEQNRIYGDLLQKFKDMEKIDNHLIEQLVHSATIFDRIIKNNDLRV